MIFKPPFPRYPIAFCTVQSFLRSPVFFARDTMVTFFNMEVVRLGTFISHLKSLKDAFVLTPEDFCHHDDWFSIEIDDD